MHCESWETRAEISAIRSELRDEVRSVRMELRDEVNVLRRKARAFQSALLTWTLFALFAVAIAAEIAILLVVKL